MITIPFNRCILSSTAVVAQQQQQINSNTSSSQGTNSSPPLSLNTILIAEILLGTTLGISSPLLFYVWKKERQDILMDLKKNEILPINSSIMVGVLILLTLGSTHTHPQGYNKPYHCIYHSSICGIVNNDNNITTTRNR